MKKIKKAVSLAIILLIIPLSVLLGFTVFRQRSYLWISLCIAIFACIPFFVSFEHGKDNTKRMMILSVMVALSVLGRFAFSAVPHFKPVTAIVVIVGMYLGAESGFLSGALSAILSNMIFGQGPWTSFQMFAWGIIGFISAFASPILKKSKIALSLYGLFAGMLFSMVMDIWTVLWWDNSFNLSRYITAIVTSLPVSIIYGVSNVIFLIVLAGPIGSKLERIIKKYGI